MRTVGVVLSTAAVMRGVILLTSGLGVSLIPIVPIISIVPVVPVVPIVPATRAWRQQKKRRIQREQLQFTDLRTVGLLVGTVALLG